MYTLFNNYYSNRVQIYELQNTFDKEQKDKCITG